MTEIAAKSMANPGDSSDESSDLNFYDSSDSDFCDSDNLDKIIFVVLIT